MATVEDGEDPLGRRPRGARPDRPAVREEQVRRRPAFTDQWINGGSMRYSPIREQLLALHRDAAAAREKAGSGA